jgi:hypothetical protein
MKSTWIRPDGRVRYLKELDANYTTEDRPLAWQVRGLQQTATGYGSRLTSSRVVRLSDGRARRIYVTQYSNVGTAWINVGGLLYVVD